MFSSACLAVHSGTSAVPQTNVAVPGDGAKTAGIACPGIQEIHVRRIIRGSLMCGGVIGVIVICKLSISPCTNVQGMASVLSLLFEPLQRPGVRGVTAGFVKGLYAEGSAQKCSTR